MSYLRTSLLLPVISLLSPTAGADNWRPLIPENSFSQWTVEGLSKADFDLQGNVLVGQPLGGRPKNSFLCSPRKYHNFELKFAFRISHPEFNSGVQFRSEVTPEGVAGPQLEMDVADPDALPLARRIGEPIYNFFTGRVSVDWASAGIYGERLNGWIFPGEAGGDGDAFEEQGKRMTKVDTWNEIKLKADGDRIQTWLNGELRVDFGYEPINKAGLICLQVHGGSYDDPSKYKIEWKNLLIREP